MMLLTTQDGSSGKKRVRGSRFESRFYRISYFSQGELLDPSQEMFVNSLEELNLFLIVLSRLFRQVSFNMLIRTS